MIQFSKLRLHGFKSFVDKTELEIGPGLTGIVGPNGCGKSNLVEALRWSMGENSAKRMRGGSGSMEDVIFAGTEKRPSRNMAEVSLLLDNTKRTAPGPYNSGDEIEVVRRIEKDHGSDYRINGKSVRARDVQLLYADITSGAGSPFLVSQGKVTALIQQKPLERRAVLEEAAGITGLYARRHEAELRLRATDANLKRLEDLIASMQERLAGLKKQARQAIKYRNLSANIRQLEVMIASLDFRRTHEKLLEIERQFGEVEAAVAERMTVVSQLNITQNVQAQDIPGLRQRDAEMAAALQAQKLALQRLEDEVERLAHQLQEAKNQLEQTVRDRAHEDQTLAENTAAIEKFESEEKEILAGRDSGDEILRAHEEARNAQQAMVDQLEAAFTALMEKLAADRARRQSLEHQTAQDSQRRENVSHRLQSVKLLLADKKQDKDASGQTDSLRGEIETHETSIEFLRADIRAMETVLEESRTTREQARRSLQERGNEKSKLEAEIKTLESIVKVYNEEGFRPVFEDIQAEKGFELALSRALGDTLMASLDEGAPVSWRKSHLNAVDLPALPFGATALTPHVQTPEMLLAALSQIGLVESEAEGDTLAAQLKPGQSLVSRDGAYWRWDGLHVRVTASDRHAVQLQQKNRLADVRTQIPAAESAITAQQDLLAQVETRYGQTQEKFSATQATLQKHETDIRGKRVELDKALQAQAARQAELAKLEEALSLAEADLVALDEALEANARTLESYNDAALAAQQVQTDGAREALAEAREALHAAIRDFEISKQEQSRREARLQAIGDERVNLNNRCIRARERIVELDERSEKLQARIEELKKRPTAIKKESEELLSRITEQETARAAVSDKLASCEAELADTTKALKQAEAALSEVREARASAQATMDERRAQLESIRAYIQEQFSMSPEELGAQAALSDEAMPDLETLKVQKDKAVRDRDLIGPVNLRAEQEAMELEGQLTGILAERNDLTEAINELRGGINTLNIEARDRLQAAFERVNEHFRDMFGRLFQGGKAHLALIESDDPLEAGLEIFAQPPGKALQSLSLLSGGEQTLTAIALIFAIFLTNPAPICVLDEVDAPLDDANVDRFCDLLDEFSERNETRFLIITHHRLTMARMDRLYGVTMAEKGVSQLVSVDLNQQFDFLEAAE
jgi:chromosome segregation protein